MKSSHFGTMPDGRRIDMITLENESIRCGIITCGAAVMSLEVPDKNGNPIDIVLGFDSLEGYLEHDKYIGAIVGRCANRIGDSRFSLGGREYTLFANIPPHHLHGGKQGFDKRVWETAEIPEGVRFTLCSPHMDEGYPGKLDVAVDYILDGSALVIKYSAGSDRDTVCNLTNHAYFNLDGRSAGSILDHAMTLFSKDFTPVSDSNCIPTGELCAVRGTPMDFNSPTVIGDRIDSDFEQLRFGSGYDHNWAVDGETGVLRPAALVQGGKSGITMHVSTTLPGIQFYAGNHLDGCRAGKGGAIYKKRDAFCLETQFFPDSPNNPRFPSPILKAGEVWAHTTVYRFEAPSHHK